MEDLNLSEEIVEKWIEENQEYKTKLQNKFKVEVEKKYTDDELLKIYESNQSLSSTLDELARKRVIAKTLGKSVKDLSPDDLNKGFVSKAQFDDVSGKLVLQKKEFAFKELVKDKFDIAKVLVDYSKVVENEDGTFTGFEPWLALLESKNEESKQNNPKVPASVPKTPQTRDKQMQELLEKGKNGDKAAMQLYNKMKRE